MAAAPASTPYTMKTRGTMNPKASMFSQPTPDEMSMLSVRPISPFSSSG